MKDSLQKTDFSHVYCPECQSIQPAFREELNGLDASGEYVGGDLLCQQCRNHIATVFRPATDDEKLEFAPGRGRA